MPTRSTHTARAGRTGAIAVAAMFLAIFAMTLLLSMTVFTPESYLDSPEGRYDYAPDTMQHTMDWRNVQRLQERIAGQGSRFMGQPGVYATEALIRAAYDAAGLEVYEQENWTVAPRTELREFAVIEDTGAAPRTDVEIFPFMPNHLQPVTTPDDGITGTLIRLTPDIIRGRARFDDCIGLIDTADGQVSQEYLYDWTRYAGLGLKGLILSHPDGLDRVPWDTVANELNGMVSSLPVNFVRLAATPAIYEAIGKTVRVRVRVRFEEVRNTTLIGILRAGETDAVRPNANALVVLTHYDACSILPDRALGVAQAVWPATQLALLDGIAPYRRHLERDVVFIATGAQMMAQDGINNLLRILDESVRKTERNPFASAFRFDDPEPDWDASISGSGNDGRVEIWEARLHTERTALDSVQGLRAHFEAPEFLVDARETSARLAAAPDHERNVFQEQLRYTLDNIAFTLQEEALERKLAFEREPRGDVESTAFAVYLDAKRRHDRVSAITRYRVHTLLGGSETVRTLMGELDLRGRMKARLDELAQYHERRARQFDKDLRLLHALMPYRDLIVLNPSLMPAAANAPSREVLSITNGHWVVDAQMRSMVSTIAAARQRVQAMPGFDDALDRVSVPALSKLHHNDVFVHTKPMSSRSANMFTQFGYFALNIVNFERSQSYLRFADPTDLPFMRDLKSLRYSLAVLGETVLALAHGNGRFAPIQVGFLKKDFGGRVLAAGVGQSLVPSFPLQGAVLANRPLLGREYAWPGFYDHLLVMTDPYGRYEITHASVDFWVDNYVWQHGYSPLAAWHGRDGRIAWMKDEGEEGQKLYKSVNLNWFEGKFQDVTLVAFRAAPIAFLDMTNPQSMADYAGVELLERDSLAPFRRRCLVKSQKQFTVFVPPDEHFYATLQSGTTGNELAKVTRGFLLGPDRASDAEPAMAAGREIDGTGYLAADHPIMNRLAVETAVSMTRLNRHRLSQQNAHNMADTQANDYFAKSAMLLAESAEAETAHRSTLRARDAVVYAMLIHPVLRSAIVEAVIGIMWYLALLAPFVYFFEKLVFAFSDIRKQFAAQALIFLTVFALLRVLHPAFTMVRSSLMILLGFIVILLAVGMSILFSGKFKENLDDLRKQRGHVDAADVSRFGVMATAFMLGLNNMNRRRMRTWLTCGTLTMITFAMISFTSVYSDVAEESTAIGRAPYQGLLIKREFFRKFSDAEVFAVRTRYGDDYEVCLRRMHFGIQNWEDKRGVNPELRMVYTFDGSPRQVDFDSVLHVSAYEPMQHELVFLTARGWFTPEDAQATETPCPVIIPDRMADRLGITAAQVDAAEPSVHINGRLFTVRGIVTSASLDAARDLDGYPLLPYDIESMSRIQLIDEQVAAHESDPRIAAENVVLAPLRNLQIQIPNDNEAVVSIALAMPGRPYREAQAAIAQYLEQSGKPAYYGLDGIAYRGKRTRETSVAGMVDLLVPLALAGLTVLNTMRGSVYERRGEIEVYNAVGIAPRYIFMIFLAEAFVYAVIGAVLGYVLSQGVGRVLTVLDLTGGLNMTYTSIATVYASLAVVITVIVSTWFPARSAMEIAKPADDAGWKIPEPEGDRLVFDLPFNFDYRDRVAVIVFLERLLIDHGEGGTGRFHASHPELTLETGDAATAPGLTVVTWLKPFDLGVSQRLDLRMPHDAETGEFKPVLALTRLSGQREAWLRLNHEFVGELRRHFLHWRAVHAADRDAMFEESKQRFERLAMEGAE